MAITGGNGVSGHSEASGAETSDSGSPGHCKAVEGSSIDLKGRFEVDYCGLPSDPKSEKLLGYEACPYHLEQELHGVLGGGA